MKSPQALFCRGNEVNLGLCSQKQILLIFLDEKQQEENYSCLGEAERCKWSALSSAFAISGGALSLASY